MELNNFITNALVGINNGIKAANDEIGEEIFRMQDSSNFIDFDVAVSVESKMQDSGEANIGIITVLGLNVNGKRENVNSNVTISHIKFKVKSLLIK